MPPINLLLFPILGGYYILIKSELFRYRQQRLEPQKLIFNSFLSGIILMMLALVFTALVSWVAPSFVDWARTLYPLKAEYFGTCVLAFLIGVGFTEVSNLFVKKDKYISRAINKIGNEFERLCESCYRNTDMIQLSLKNDKCYVGWVKSLPIPSSSSHITILPVYSGYRNKENKRLQFTTQYLDVYATYVREGDVLDIRDLAALVIKIDEIVSANKFDPDMYERFNSTALSSAISGGSNG
jgi:hypothetical protein